MLFYLSCTGNTQWAARQIAAQTGERLTNLREAILGDCRYSLAEGERLGFALPIHGWRPPRLVREFVRRMVLDTTPDYAYVVWTAGDNIGLATEMLAGDLGRRGVRLDSAFSLIMPESYVGLPFMDVDTPDNEKRKIGKAASDLKGFIDDILARRRGVAKTVKGVLPWLLTYPIGGLFAKLIVSDKPFRVVGERCIKCGRCAAVCPVADIDGGKGKMPRWKRNGKCLSCFACYHHCPAHAIEYGCRTRHKGQYYFSEKRKAKSE